MTVKELLILLEDSGDKCEVVTSPVGTEKQYKVTGIQKKDGVFIIKTNKIER